MKKDDLKLRTKRFALRVLKLVDALPPTNSGRVNAGQFGRSGTSAGANYRAAGRARSRAEFIAKLGIVEEEADESAFGMELATESGAMSEKSVASLLQEANELTAIMVASIKSTRAGRKSDK